jgi:Na+-transporting methylmalonyl-CoA/oxaloacetate decarboxylase gamma subunit
MDPSSPHFGLTLTALGMGTVFTVLILLAVFTSLFNRFFSRREAPQVIDPACAPAPAPEPPEQAAPVNEEPQLTSVPMTRASDPLLHAKRKRAAAIAVAVLLAARQVRVPLFQPRLDQGRGWRDTYRQRTLIGRRR